LLTKTVLLIEQLDLGPGSRAFQKNDLLSLMIEIYKKGPDLVLAVDSLGEDLRSFYAAVDSVAEGRSPEEWGDLAVPYHAAVISGSNDRASRLRRGGSLSSVLAPHFASVSDESSFSTDVPSESAGRPVS
jgi:hypothetical protein